MQLTHVHGRNLSPSQSQENRKDFLILNCNHRPALDTLRKQFDSCKVGSWETERAQEVVFSTPIWLTLFNTASHQRTWQFAAYGSSSNATLCRAWDEKAFAQSLLTPKSRFKCMQCCHHTGERIIWSLSSVSLSRAFSWFGLMCLGSLSKFLMA